MRRTSHLFYGLHIVVVEYGRLSGGNYRSSLDTPLPRPYVRVISTYWEVLPW